MADTDHDYVLGHSVQEQERLLLQGRFLRPYTEKYLRAAGIGVGMHVLDIGCGIGDVALLAADMVGPGGSVTCIDRDSAAIDKAELRAKQHGCSSWMQFSVSALNEFLTEQKFDALIGRYILLYQPDPVAIIKHLLTFLKPGAIVAFHEVDFPDAEPSYPPCPLFNKAYSLIGEAFTRSGVSPHYGRQIGHSFLCANLAFPTIMCEGIIGGGRASYVYSWVAATLMTVAPRLKQLGVQIPSDLSLDHTLAARLEEEAVRLGSQLLAPVQYGAWSRVQAT
jgi:ubiquinone/menaquinone biosynthesis C-methylase UbiE